MRRYSNDAWEESWILTDCVKGKAIALSLLVPFFLFSFGLICFESYALENVVGLVNGFGFWV